MTMRTGKQKLQPSSLTFQAFKPRSTTQMKSWGHCPWKPFVLPTHLSSWQELTQMGQQKRQQKMAGMECSSNSLTTDPSGSLWQQGSSQQITELKLIAAQTLTRKRDFLATQCFDWLPIHPAIFNHQVGSRSSATSDRSCPYLRTKHLWPFMDTFSLWCWRQWGSRSVVKNGKQIGAIWAPCVLQWSKKSVDKIMKQVWAVFTAIFTKVVYVWDKLSHKNADTTTRDTWPDS